MQTSTTHPAVARLKGLLSRTLRICASDERIFIGTFVCVDKQGNVILTNTEEFRLGGSLTQGRHVGMIMVPWRMVLKVEAQDAKGRGGRIRRDDSLYL